jgi:transcriptional regulator with XRE-family HTH domain
MSQNGQRQTREVSELITETQRRMKQWGITLSYVARQMGVSRQYAWQILRQRTVVSEERAREFERSVESIIRRREHLPTFGARLRAARVAAGLTLKQVAALIGYSWVGVERWERDVCLPKPGVLWHLLSLYGIDHSRFVQLTASPEYSASRGNSGYASLRTTAGVRGDLALSLFATGGIFQGAQPFRQKKMPSPARSSDSL